jgi:hypothetical protein
VEVVRCQVERIGVGEQLREAGGDGGTVLVGDADVDAGGGLGHEAFSGSDEYPA